MVAPALAEEIINAAVAVARGGGDGLSQALEALPAPIYVTDAEGVVTHYNSDCVGFAGRRPAIGKDRWCVTWKLYAETGEFMPHETCPMAQAILERRPIRGLSAVAERPDGARVTFTPFPTPLFDEAGELIGAVNMLIDVTEDRQIDELRSQALRCLRLSTAVDSNTSEALSLMAAEYQAKADDLDRGRKQNIRVAPARKKPPHG